jgi:hypothetical protein
MLKNYEKFEAIMQEFFLHFNRTATKLTCTIWFNYLSEYLDEKELLKAVSLSLVEDRILPTAKELMEKINGKNSDISEKCWLEIVNLAKSYSSTSDIYNLIPLASFYSLQKVGGISKIANSDKWELKDLRELFLVNFRDVFDLPEDEIKSKINFSFINKSKPKEIKEEDLITPEQLKQLRNMLSSVGNF